MGRFALEIGTIRQYRETRRAALSIGTGEGRRIEIRADEPRARGSLFDLGDEAEAPRLRGALQRGDEAARRRRFGGGTLDIAPGTRLPRERNLCTLAGNDAGENITHALASGALVIATSFASACFAAPEAIDLAPIATPSLRSFALPATIRAAAALSSTMSRIGPSAPSSSSWSFVAFAAGSPPRS